MAIDTTVFTGAVGTGTPLIASAANKQIRVKKMIVSNAKVQANKVLQIKDENGVLIFAVDLGVVGPSVFEPGVSKGEDYVLPVDKDLDYEADSTSGNVNVSIVTNYHLDDHS